MRRVTASAGAGSALPITRMWPATLALVAEVEFDWGTSMVRVPHSVAAVDAGLIINPDGLTSQIEGGIVQSVSWTLKEEVRFDQSGILTRDWAHYQILTT